MEENSKGIKHTGVVTAVSDSMATVLIVSKNACASCHVKSACSALDTKDKIVEANIPEGELVAVGDEVDVVISQSNGYLAVFMSYILPVIILFAVIITANSLGYSEIVGALCGLALMAIYFAVLYLLRKKIDKKLIIEVVSKRRQS